MKRQIVHTLTAYRAAIQTLTCKSTEGRVVDCVREITSSPSGVCQRRRGRAVRGRHPATDLGVRNATLPPRRRMKGFRVGNNLGDVIVDGERIPYGDGVNIAARLRESRAPGGGVSASPGAWRAGEGQAGSALRSDLGAQPVKNIAEPVRAYLVGDELAGAVPPAASWHEARTAISRRQVVLAAIALLAVLGAGVGAWATAARPPVRSLQPNKRRPFAVPRSSISIMTFSRSFSVMA